MTVESHPVNTRYAPRDPLQGAAGITQGKRSPGFMREMFHRGFQAALGDQPKTIHLDISSLLPMIKIGRLQYVETLMQSLDPNIVGTYGGKKAALGGFLRSNNVLPVIEVQFASITHTRLPQFDNSMFHTNVAVTISFTNGKGEGKQTFFVEAMLVEAHRLKLGLPAVKGFTTRIEAGQFIPLYLDPATKSVQRAGEPLLFTVNAKPGRSLFDYIAFKVKA